MDISYLSQYGFSSTVYTSSAITPMGDLYRHEGWAPVVAGMFLLGCGVRFLDDVMDVRENPHAVFLVLLLFPVLVKNEVDWVLLLLSIPGIVVIWVLAVALIFRKRRWA
jgi:threonine/homoserine/homoserine lactone efflux protein